MELTICGSRGSVASPSGRKPNGEMFNTMEYGGNTSCYYLSACDRNIILDAGTGISPLGDYLLENNISGNLELLISHPHWDHIQGFPFFTPAYIPNCNVNIYGEAPIKGQLIKALQEKHMQDLIVEMRCSGIKDVFANQQNERNFPVDLGYMKGVGEFNDFIPGGLLSDRENLRIETYSLSHPGGCVSYKFTDKNTGNVFIYSTDFEPDFGENDERMIEWWRDADLVLADAQYEQSEDAPRNKFLKTFGHSDPFTNVDYAQRANVSKILMTHHDRKSDDRYLGDFERRSQIYGASKGVEVLFAKEGMKLEI